MTLRTLITGLLACSVGLPSLAAAAVDLVLNHTDTGFDPMPAGGIVEYQLRIDNNGLDGATGVTLTDTLPIGAVFVSATPGQGSCAAPIGGVLTCSLGALPSLGSVLTTVRVRPLSAGSITNTASSSANESDADPSNNTAISEVTTVQQGADLAASITPSTPSVVAGASFSFQFDLINNGPDTATNVAMSATLPTSFLITSSAPSGCSFSGQTMSCSLSGAITPGATRSVGGVTGIAAVAGGSTLTAASSTSITSPSSPQDPTASNNIASASVTVSTGTDLRVALSASPSGSVVVGGTVTLSSQIHYNGDVPSSPGFVLTLPANLTPATGASFTSGGWSCSTAGQTVSCIITPPGSAGANISLGTISVPANVIAANSGTVSATVSTSSPEANLANNTATRAVTGVIASMDLRSTKTAPDPSYLMVGTPFAWQLSTRNMGTAPVAGRLQLIDTMPHGLTINSYGSGWTCTPATPFVSAPGNDTITCERIYTSASPLGVGASAPTLLINTTASIDGLLTNTYCSAALPNGTDVPPSDSDPSNDCASAAVTSQTPGDSTDLRLRMSAAPSPVQAGDVVVYEVEVINDGPAAANDVRLTNNFLNTLLNGSTGPTGAGFISCLIAPGNSTGGACASSAGGAFGRNTTATFTQIPVCIQGVDCPVVTYTVRHGGDARVHTQGATVIARATAERDPTNNNSSASVTILSHTDVSVTSTVTPASVPAGQPVTWVVSVRNNGPSTASPVSLSELVPVGMRLISRTASGGAVCLGGPPAGEISTVSNQRIDCTWPWLTNGQQQTLTMVLAPSSILAGASATDSASVTTATTESMLANNLANAALTVLPPVVDLLINHTDSPDPVAVGDTVSMTLSATNNGPSWAEAVQIEDALPASRLSYQSITLPAGVVCPTLPAVGSFGGSVVCSLGDLSPGSSRSLTIQLLGTARGVTSATANARSTETLAGFDPIPVNNTAVEATTVRDKADLSVDLKAATPGSVELLQPFTWTIDVTNNGPGVGEQVRVSDTLPAGMQLTGPPTVVVLAGVSTPPSCTGTSGQTSFVCSAAEMQSGARLRITVPVVVSTWPSAGSLVNAATVSTDSKDEVPANDTNSGSVTVRAARIQAQVWVDLNNDGLSGGAEPGIGAVQIQLNGTAWDGSAVNRTLVTDATGMVTFAGLPRGTYDLIEGATPAPYLDGRERVGTAGGIAGADRIDGITAALDVLSGGYGFGEIPPARIAGSVYVDANNDGVRDGSDAPIGGVVIALTGTDDLGAVTLSQATDSSGNFSFTTLRPGTYQLDQTQPATYLLGLSAPGSFSAGTGSAGAVVPDPRGNRIDGVVLDPGAELVGVRFGEVEPVTLSGRIFVDTDGNGVRGPTETAGVGAIPVRLEVSNDLGQAFTCTATSAANGAYAFPVATDPDPRCQQLRPGTYELVVTHPAPLVSTGIIPGTGTGTPGTPQTNPGDARITLIGIGSGEDGTDFDFGYTGDTLIGGRVMVDSDGSGTASAGDRPLAGVAISIAGRTGAGVDLCTIYPCQTTTDASGAYSFTNLPASDASGYTVRERDALGAPSAILGDFADGPEVLGTINGSTTGSIGADQFSGLVIPMGQIGAGYDFLESGASLAGSVCIDASDDGRCDLGETGLAGIVVTLSGSTGSGASVCSVISPCSITTDGVGAYRFAGLPAGSYRIEAAQATALADGREGAGTAGGVAPNTGFSASPADNRIDAIALGVGVAATGYDFGERTGALGGVVFSDLNNNGVRDGAEPPIAGVAMRLTGINSLGNPISQATTTDPSGQYAFAGLAAADAAGYVIEQTQPSGWRDGRISTTACASCMASTPEQIAGLSRVTSIAFTPGTAVQADFGELAPASVAGHVLVDVQPDSLADGADLPIAAVPISLTGTDDLGNPVSVLRNSAADGSFVFADLRPGTYRIDATQPAGYAEGNALVGTAGGTVPGPNTIEAVGLSAGTTATGYVVLERGARIEGDVYIDDDDDGVRDALEIGIAGVQISIAGPENRTLVTDASGKFAALGLIAGTYSIIELPGPALAPFGDGRDTLGSAGGTQANDRADGVILAPGASATGYLFGERPSASIAGAVFLDQNGNGLREAGEPGIAGVSIQLAGTTTSGDDICTLITSCMRVTDAMGAFRFDGLSAGTYSVLEMPSTALSTYEDGADLPGSAGGSTLANDRIESVVLGPTTAASDYLFGERPGLVGTINGTVWRSIPGGVRDVQEAGETGQPGWLVQLWRGTALIDTATTAGDGRYAFGAVAPAIDYRIRFVHPVSGAVYGDPVAGDAAAVALGETVIDGELQTLVIQSGAVINNQDLPIDPSGVVYDSLTRQPVAGAQVTLLDAGGNPVAPGWVVGGAANVTQLTGADGMYQFLLLPGAPAGIYSLQVVAPGGYAPAPSSLIAAQTGPLVVPAAPNPFAVVPGAFAPALGDPTTHYFSFVLGPGVADVINNHLPLDPQNGGAVTVTKQAAKRQVSIGQIVPYTITVTPNGGAAITDVTLVDTLPAGFAYVRGSARFDGVEREPARLGNTLRWPGLTLSAGQTLRVELMAAVGAGVRDGRHINRAHVRNSAVVLSNVAEAAVDVLPDPVFDCTDIVGRVFDDRNANGYPDAGEEGVAAVRLVSARGLVITTDRYGRYHVPCAQIPNLERGSNFILKLDERSLPTGYRVTSENPRVVRATRGRMVKANFGVTIHRVVRVEIHADGFDQDGLNPTDATRARIGELMSTLSEAPSVLRLAYRLRAPDEPAAARLEQLVRAIEQVWAERTERGDLVIETELIEVQR